MKLPSFVNDGSVHIQYAFNWGPFNYFFAFAWWKITFETYWYKATPNLSKPRRFSKFYIGGLQQWW